MSVRQWINLSRDGHTLFVDLAVLERVILRDAPFPVIPDIFAPVLDVEIPKNTAGYSDESAIPRQDRASKAHRESEYIPIKRDGSPGYDP